MRYLQDFKQVAALYARHASIPEIRAATGRSARVISEYVALYERAKREFPAAPRLRDLLDPAKAKRGGESVTGEPRSQVDYRRLAKRNLHSLLRYKFLNEYGYDKGPVVVEAIVADICDTVRGYYLHGENLEPGQLLYLAPAKEERAGRGKTIAKTRMIPVRLTLVDQEDLDAIRDGAVVALRREIRVRRLTHQAYEQGAVLSQRDLSLLLGYSDSASSLTAVALRKRGEWLPSAARPVPSNHEWPFSRESWCVRA